MSNKVFRFSAVGAGMDLDDMMAKKPSKDKVVKTEPDIAKKNSAKDKPKNTKKKQENDSLQALAFGNGKNKKKVVVPGVAPVTTTTNGTATPVKVNGSSVPDGSKKAKPNSVNCNGVHKDKTVSDEWKNRDQKYVEDTNEKQLREAMLLSKLDFEANKQTSKKKEDAEEAKAKKKKKEKPITVSLSEFNTMDTKKLTNGRSVKTKPPVTELKDDNFFADVDKAVKTTLQKESRQKQYTEQQLKEKKSNKQRAATNASPVLVAISEVEKRDFEIQALRLEVLDLKGNLDKVKLRNKKLCEVLAAAEMKSIGEVVIELEKVSKARDEFSAEVASLSEQLEQEKTKVSQLQDKHRKK